MDRRTAELLDALKHPGGAFLLHLLEGPDTEAGLIARTAGLPGVDQSTANRRLSLLARVGLVEREAGRRNAPGRKWQLSEASATRPLLTAALDLSEAVAETERRARAQAKKTATGKGRLRSVK